jgi:Sulfite exporter TauE/SafE
MPKSWKGFWEGPGFCILGGMPGAFVGIWMLSHLPAEQLMKIFGILLIMYCIYSMFKPAGAKIRGFDGPVTGAIVGFIGGAIGGFTAFPGAAVVVWTSLRHRIAPSSSLIYYVADLFVDPDRPTTLELSEQSLLDLAADDFARGPARNGHRRDALPSDFGRQFQTGFLSPMAV